MPEVLDRDTLLGRYPILRFFEFDHLKGNLARLSSHFHAVAWAMAQELPYSAETSTFLRKLLEAKDCAVRAARDA